MVRSTFAICLIYQAFIEDRSKQNRMSTLCEKTEVGKEWKIFVDAKKSPTFVGLKKRIV